MTERQDVQYSSGGDVIRAWFYPGSGSGRRPAIIFCPGFTGTKFAAFYQPYVAAFVAAGWSVLLADYRGWGESGGPRGEIVPQRQVDDIRAGLTYLASRADVDLYRLALFGVSFGGGHAAAVAGLDSRVRACIAVSPVSDGEQWLHEMRREYEWRQFLAELDENDAVMVAGGVGRSVAAGDGIMIPTPEKRSTNIKGDVPAEMVPSETPLWCARAIIDFRPVDQIARTSAAVLVFAVSRDETVPAAHGRAIFEASPRARRLVTIEAASHYATYIDHLDTISAHSLAWLAEHAAPVEPTVE
jgi:pimeloyl-ACP methyl ester carboxylesterase